MYNCKWCIRRCLNTFIGDINLAGQTCIYPSRIPSATRKAYNTGATPNQTEDRPSKFSVSRLSDNNSQSQLSKNRSASQETLSRDEARQRWLDSRGQRPTDKVGRFVPSKTRAIQKELVYVKDPLKLAEVVRDYLRKDLFLQAEELVKAASKDVLCTVSWNHMVDYLMSNGKINSAIKIYNEMKKRGQMPDAHTYTILFRGLADHTEGGNHPMPLARALSIYHSMDAENSPVKPTIIHTNAVLKVCARAHDLDAMFGIAAKLRSKGQRAPNNLTFTTILNAIRQNVIMRGNLSETESGRSRDKAVKDAIVIWQDVVSRWRQGDIWIDEELVCSMGRVLLLGNKQNQDDIFSLIQQTMNIPRQFPRLGTADRAKIEPSAQGKIAAAAEDGSMPENVPCTGNETSVEPEVASTGVGIQDQFAQLKIDPPKGSKTTSPYAKPGNNVLSLIGEALLDASMKEAMAKYWNILTKENNVKPDRQNYHAYLRILRVARASSETVEFLAAMPMSFREKKTFRIAMSVCVRDKNNRSAFTNAGKILDMMQNSLAELDVLALQSYLTVAVKSPAYSEKVSSSDKNDTSKLALGKQMSRALKRLGPSLFNLKAALQYPSESPETQDKKQIEHLRQYKKDTVVLVREMISAHDKIIQNGMVPREEYAMHKQERSKLAAYIPKRAKTKKAGAKNDNQKQVPDVEQQPVQQRDEKLDT